MVAQLQRDMVTTLESPSMPAVSFGVEPGQVVGLTGIPGSGLTRIGLSFLAPYAHRGPLAYMDVRGWMNPVAAWELGIPPDQLVVVRSQDVVTWGRIVATLLSGVRGVYAEVPPGVRDGALRKLVAKARVHRTPMVLRPTTGSLPSGIAHLRLDARGVTWEGIDDGHGQLERRTCLLDAAGKAISGMQRTIEVEDDGTNDLCVVPDVGAAPTRRLA